MVTYITLICLTISALLAPISATAADAVFTFTPASATVRAGEPIVLNAALDGASFIGQADMSALNAYGSIESTGHNKASTFINGVLTVKEQHSYYFIPDAPGIIDVPSFTFQTTDGVRTSAPFTLRVLENTSLSDEIHVSLSTPEDSLYKGAPFMMTVTIDTKNGIGAADILNLSHEDAIIDEAGHRMYDKRAPDGSLRKIIDNMYTVTPLKDGPLTLGPVTLSGRLRGKARSGLRGMLPFSMIGVPQGKAFRVTSDPLHVTIAPLPDGAQHMTPATAFTITEQSDHHATLTSGVPYIRTLMIEAKGITSSRLPDISDNNIADESMRVYADPAQTTDDITDNILRSMKRQRFTLVPERAGAVTLPAITMEWFNTRTHQIESATLPARVMQVIENPEAGFTTPADDITIIDNNNATKQDDTAQPDARISYMSFIITACFTLLCIGLAYIYRRPFIDACHTYLLRRQLCKKIADCNTAHTILHNLSQWPASPHSNKTIYERIASDIPAHLYADFIRNLHILEHAAYAPDSKHPHIITEARNEILRILRAPHKKGRAYKHGLSQNRNNLNPL